MNRALTAILKSAADLTTPHDKVRAGFLELALEKTRQAAPFLEEGRHLRALAASAVNPAALWSIKEIRPGLLTAAGLSEKARTHITGEEQKSAFLQMAREILESCGADFVDELTYRFLLTRGDALGGKMRNIAGKMAKRKFVNRICAAVRLRGGTVHPAENPDTAERTKFLTWEFAKRPRTLMLDFTIPQTRTNVDAVLLSSGSGDAVKAVYTPENCIAMGELKGGIDPAGADEHWKTATRALARIRGAFAGSQTPPSLFFIGAAIETRMSEEIYRQLHGGELAFAANLTNDIQLSAICEWLIKL